MATKYLNATQLCERLGVTKVTLHRWQNNPDVGLPTPARINGIRFYPVSEIDAWIESKRG